ncbi:glutaredoxin-2, mitochondrial-like [Gigantopelta aegis]|uniref:glutaredoxin-2, mitochondrial-like n=1 Tax=Gigantopelta aegis TaxID=1735272 RepID=UPI001B88B058|nr:glutaredoxin-2, mitochondrial-like [Gigantopelta aegis]XP_041366496.1 glutaredoxin-2, mitochondrial-like [Gigantopelta aegis]
MEVKDMGNILQLSDTPERADIVDTISSHCVVIYSKTSCSYCKQAKNIFQKLKVPVKVIELDERKDGELLQHVLGDMTNSTTVPRVFVNGECIGGARETQALHRKGKLAEMTAACQ